MKFLPYLALILTGVAGNALSGKSADVHLVIGGKTVSAVESKSPSEAPPLNCLLCEAAVYTFENKVLPAVKSEQEMDKVVTDLCNRLTGNFTNCTMIGADIGKLLWEGKDFSPVKACEMMKICPNNTVEDDWKGKESTNQRMVSAVKSKSPSKDPPLNCLLCEAAVFTFEHKVLPAVKSEQEMDKVVTDLCNKLTGNLKNCTMIGAAIGKLLWEGKSFSPSKACQMLKVCPNNTVGDDWRGKASTNQRMVYTAEETFPIADVPVNCVFCQAAVFTFEKEVLPNIKTEQGVDKEITDLCNRITGNFTSCGTIGSLIGHQLWKSKQYPPLQACQMMKICPNNTVEDYKGLISRLGNSPLEGVSCTLCKVVASIAKFAIVAEQNPIEKAIIDLICHKLPPAPAQECETAVQNDLPDLLEKYLDPDTICGLLKLC